MHKLGEEPMEPVHGLHPQPGQLLAAVAKHPQELRATVSASGTTLTQIQGIGFLTAAKILALTADIRRFPNQEHYASYAGTAPIDVSSGEQETHRLSRRGNRQLNAAIHVAAVTQARDPGPGRDHYRRKLTEHKTPQRGPPEPEAPAFEHHLSPHPGRSPTHTDSRRLTHRGALEPLPALGRRPELRRPCESHTTSVGSRCESDSPGAWTEAWPGSGPEAMKQVADERECQSNIPRPGQAVFGSTFLAARSIRAR
jgi:hypothetical protein